MPRTVLLVDTDRDALNAMGTTLRAAGYTPTLAGGWEEGAALVKTERFSVVIAAHRLGAHNGLHLVLRARAMSPDVSTIVTTPASDSVLEKEAASFGAFTLVAPWTNAGALLSALELLKSVQPS